MEEKNLSIIKMMDESIKKWEQQVAEGKDRTEVEKEAMTETSNNLFVVRYLTSKKHSRANLINFHAVDAWKTLIDTTTHILSNDPQVAQPAHFEKAAETVWAQIYKFEEVNNDRCKCIETFLQENVLNSSWGFEMTCLKTPVDTYPDAEMMETLKLIPISLPSDTVSFVTLTILLMPSAYTTDDLKNKVFPRTNATAQQIQNILRIQYLVDNYD